MEKYIKSRFGIDAIDEDEYYVGYNKVLENGKCENWNGWAAPCFEKDVVEKMLNDDVFKDTYSYIYNSKEDTYTLIPNEGFGEDTEEFDGFDIMFNGKLKHVYGIGAFAWCWDDMDN